VDYLNRVFARGLSTNIVRVQGPIVISQRTQLQPDLSVLRERKDFYRQSLARPEDCLLVIEVADTTVRFDREGKIPICGKAGIPEAWLIDLENRQLFVYTMPTPDGYRNSVRPDPGDRVSPSLLPEVSLVVAELFVV
jgi:Uma2 family endonuclease